MRRTRDQRRALKVHPKVDGAWAVLGPRRLLCLPKDKGSRWETMDRDSSLKPLHKHGRANRNSAPQCGVIFGCILSKVRWSCFGVGEAGGAPSPGGRQARLPLETQDWETGEWVVTCSVGTICLLGFPMGCTVQCWLSSRRVG